MSPNGEIERDVVRPVPAEAREHLARDAEEAGGRFREPRAYDGAVGRTTFDGPTSADGSVTVVLPQERLDAVPSQSLVRVTSMPDGREYVATVTAGPFCEPDGMSADAPALVVSAVNGAMMMPRHHGRVQVTVLGQQMPEGLTVARHRPRPNSPVHRVPDKEMAEILGLHGEMRLGHAYGHEGVEVRVPTTDKAVLPRHTAVVGTTGSGKSTGVGRYIAGLQESGVCTFVFDVEGEYTRLDEPMDNPRLVAALRERGLGAHAVEGTHVYHLVGRECANMEHPRRAEFSLRLSEISPYAFAEIMDLSDAMDDRLMKIYELAKRLLREFKIFPREGVEADQRLVLEVDEFDRGWPALTLEHLCYLVSGVLNLADGKDEEPYGDAKGFTGNWGRIRQAIYGQFGGLPEGEGDADGGAKGKKGARSGPKFGDTRSWGAVSNRLHRLRRLKVFNSNEQPLPYVKMLAAGRVNIIDLSDLENNDVRNLAIAEILHGVLEFQQRAYEAAVREGRAPLMTNVIVEEAHEFLSARRVAKMPALRDQLVKIARRGRKRYLGLTFVTQSPNDLPDEVLGVVNNWVMYKLDEPVIRRLKSFVANADESLWTLVRGLGQGQALTSFAHMRRPVITAMDPSPARLRMTE